MPCDLAQYRYTLGNRAGRVGGVAEYEPRRPGALTVPGERLDLYPPAYGLCRQFEVGKPTVEGNGQVQARRPAMDRGRGEVGSQRLQHGVAAMAVAGADQA